MSICIAGFGLLDVDVHASGSDVRTNTVFDTDLLLLTPGPYVIMIMILPVILSMIVSGTLMMHRRHHVCICSGIFDLLSPCS